MRRRKIERKKKRKKEEEEAVVKNETEIKTCNFPCQQSRNTQFNRNTK